MYNHIKNHQINAIQARLQPATDHTRRSFQPLTYPSSTRSSHGWSECVILGLHPFSFCEEKVIPCHYKHDSISRNTVLSYMHELFLIVEENVSHLLPDKCSIVFDGWAGGDTNDVGLFSTYPDKTFTGYTKLLLGILPWNMRTP